MNLELKNPTLFRDAAFIGGEWISGNSKERIEVFNPGTQEKLGSVPSVSSREVGRAIECAKKAFASWRKLLPKERADFLLRFYRLMIENVDDLARLITLEQGKTLAESKGEILYAASYVEWYAEEARRIYGDVLPQHRSEVRNIVLKEPVGVVATITPWNFPSAMLARKVAPALAAGCTLVSKPAELTPFSALALGVLAEQAGLPKGVWNILNGSPEAIGKEFSSNSTVRKLSFTGSTRVGKLLMAQCGLTVKRLSLELGGNAPFIVFESADIEKAIQGGVAAKFRNNGQTCVCVNRFIVHEKVREKFERLLLEKVQKFRVGNGLDSNSDLGPLINKAALTKVTEHIADACQLGAKILCGGQVISDLYFQPTVITGANAKMRLAQEETFGPVAAIFPFQEEREAIELANATEYGLAAYFYSQDPSQIWRVAESLQAGVVGINEGIFSSATIPFGGVKESGFGREGSKYGLEDYLQTKYLCWSVS